MRHLVASHEALLIADAFARFYPASLEKDAQSLQDQFDENKAKPESMHIVIAMIHPMLEEEIYPSRKNNPQSPSLFTPVHLQPRHQPHHRACHSANAASGLLADLTLTNSAMTALILPLLLLSTSKALWRVLVAFCVACRASWLGLALPRSSRYKLRRSSVSHWKYRSRAWFKATCSSCGSSKVSLIPCQRAIESLFGVPSIKAISRLKSPDVGCVVFEYRGSMFRLLVLLW
jgi:hypothetical protein